MMCACQKWACCCWPALTTWPSAVDCLLFVYLLWRLSVCFFYAQFFFLLMRTDQIVHAQRCEFVPIFNTSRLLNVKLWKRLVQKCKTVPVFTRSSVWSKWRICASFGSKWRWDKSNLQRSAFYFQKCFTNTNWASGRSGCVDGGGWRWLIQRYCSAAGRAADGGLSPWHPRRAFVRGAPQSVWL